MKTIVAALAGLTLGMGVASAQGLPVGSGPQVYGSVWAAEKLAAERTQTPPSVARADDSHSATANKRAAAGG